MSTVRDIGGSITGEFKNRKGDHVNIIDKIDPTPLEESSSMIAVAGTAVPLAEAIPEKAVGAIIQPTVDIRYWLDGSTPTATDGFLLEADSMMMLDSKAQCDGFRMIAVSAAGELACGYLKYSEEA